MQHASSPTILKPLSIFLAMLAVAVICGGVASAQTGQVIHQFKGEFATPPDGAAPAAALTLAPDGMLYGTTSSGGVYNCEDAGNSFNCGTAFALEPPSAEKPYWGERVIYNFGNPQYDDGEFPGGSPLILDSVGNLYGTMELAGIGGCGPYGLWSCGSVFQLARPASKGGAWTYNLLYDFQPDNGDGYIPQAGPVFDKQGNLYGTTIQGGPPDGEGAGTVYELSPPASNGDPWTETILYGFEGSPDGDSPNANLVMDAAGNLFSTTVEGGTGNYCGKGCGTIFELSPPKTNGAPWTETILYSFQGGADGNYPNGVIFGKDGSLYGTTRSGGNGSGCSGEGCGTVFKLSPPSVKGAAWTETILYRFQGGTDGDSPVGNLVVDSQGLLWGTTTNGGYQGEDCSPVGCGTVFALIPTRGVWVEKIVYAFKPNRAGFSPQAGLTLGKNGNLFGTAAAGGFSWDCGKTIDMYSCGTVFEVIK
ncbi:MAG TPA: choice-of-anchor tandem repeat GloVer-containing protein [Terriglobales bacterium]|nr:choice-of-anchor tandem repeat GloVer-containing protein [Terriglobales bacterium]